MAQMCRSAVSRPAAGRSLLARRRLRQRFGSGMCSSLACVTGPVHRGTDTARATPRRSRCACPRAPDPPRADADGRHPRGAWLWHAERARALGGRADPPRGGADTQHQIDGLSKRGGGVCRASLASRAPSSRTLVGSSPLKATYTCKASGLAVFIGAIVNTCYRESHVSNAIPHRTVATAHSQTRFPQEATQGLPVKWRKNVRVQSRAPSRGRSPLARRRLRQRLCSGMCSSLA
jgi:hypothetical protein